MHRSRLKVYRVVYMTTAGLEGPVFSKEFETFVEASAFALKQPQIIEIKLYDNQTYYLQD